METLVNYLSSLNKDIFVIIKPGFLNLSSEIVKIFQDNEFSIKKSVTKKLTIEEAHKLYEIHKDEDFYEDLCKYMSSDITTAFIFRNKNYINDIFDFVGKIKDEIREKYGESDMRNVIHSSDSSEHMKNESKIYFNIV